VELNSPQRKSINAEHRDGSSCSSDEVSVMEAEQRGRPIQLNSEDQPLSGRNLHSTTKSYNISKQLIVDAYKRVKANKGSAGVDRQSLKDFDANLMDNLYQLWNRLSSGSYHPQPVLRVEIPKSDGGIRCLGIPTVTDRIAQMVVKLQIEPNFEMHFHPDSFGYRPNKSAHDALQLAQQRCRKRAWVLDMDIKGFFDTIDHKLLMQCVRRHVKESWQLLYIERWLKSPIATADGDIEQRDRGTPQGGVISPLLANLFLHYVFDVWVGKQSLNIQFERYADDILCHCISEAQAISLKEQVEARFIACGLALHPKKTKIAFCKNQYRKENYDTISFDFLSYTFRPHWSKTKNGNYGLYFYPTISRKAAKRIRNEINNWPWHYWSHQELTDIRKYSRSKIRGWMNYFGVFGQGAIRNILFQIDRRLSRWAKMKYKTLKTLRQAANRVNRARANNPHWFAHWSY